MNSTATTAPLGIDPLIAEAKRRARRRQMIWLLAAVALVISVVAATMSDPFRPSGSTSISTGPARLNNAVALGTLVALDRRTDVAKFRISCGWHATNGRATTRLRPGLYSVSVRGGLFNVGGYVHAEEENFSTWERWHAHPGWQASLYLGPASSRPYLSNGPTTDICHGVLG